MALSPRPSPTPERCPRQSGQVLDFTGGSDRFAGTLGGSGLVEFTGGSDTLIRATLAGNILINGGAVTVSSCRGDSRLRRDAATSPWRGHHRDRDTCQRRPRRGSHWLLGETTIGCPVKNAGIFLVTAGTFAATGEIDNVGTIDVAGGTLQLLAGSLSNPERRDDRQAEPSWSGREARCNSPTTPPSRPWTPPPSKSQGHARRFRSLDNIDGQAGESGVEFQPTSARRGCWRFSGGDNIAMSNTLANSGTIELQGGTLAAAGLVGSGLIVGFGTVAAPMTDTGKVSAQSGQVLDFDGAGDSFAGTLGGGGTVELTGGSDTFERSNGGNQRPGQRRRGHCVHGWRYRG